MRKLKASCYILFSMFFIFHYCQTSQQTAGNALTTETKETKEDDKSNEWKIPSQTEKNNDVIELRSSPFPDDTQALPTIRPQIPIAKPNFPRVAVPFVIAMWVFGTCIMKLILSGWPKLLTVVPESCCLILTGIFVGIIFYITNTTVLSPLSSTIFFFCMLPPIIFDAGFFMPNRPFFDHLGTILLFAVMGTIFNTVCIGISLWACGLSGLYGFQISLLETLIFSALISAVDPVAVLAVFEEIHVDKVLYIIVFGESLLNDAVTVVLYNMCDSYISLGPENIEASDVLSGFASFVVVALGGTMIGIFWGFLTGFVTKYTHRVLVIEPIFIFIMSYVAYVNAEAFQMSGILSIMFCGITMKNYVAENVSTTSLTTVKCGLKVLSNGSESIIFMFLGISTVNDYHEWNTAFIGLTIFFCSLYRALGVVLLTEIANYFRLHQLNRVEKFVMSYGGLRGAIAFALVLLIDPKRIPHQPLFVTATISVVFFTVFVQGITMKPLVEFLKVKREENQEKTMNERLHEKMLDYTMAGVVDILNQLSSNKVRDKFKQFDYAYIRPYLIREKKHHEPKILETYSKLTMQDAVEFARRNPSSWTVQGTNSFASFFRNDTTANFLPSNEGEINLDFGELNFKPSTKDLWDAETHHMLPDAVCMSHRSKCVAGHSTSSSHISRNNSKRKRVSGSEAVNINKHRVEKQTSCEQQQHTQHEMRNRRQGVPADVLDNERGLSYVKSNINEVKKEEKIEIDYEEEGGISFVVYPQTYEDSKSVEISAVIEMPLPWKTDLGSPQQRPKEFFHDI
ncbi:probable Na(+)/H(+) antiporter nhx-9 isoform X1 [Daphnia pulicaria]|uniref:probable Na(+)/H(+) antiporter nhx-9 isoform X1 n=1 Tax=Daphnia pulicaria TaxID=35523 RepID=UPI001EE9F93D|nr:probable Na(+)/H(+) antiporter nhx-9 isoform X1 [Daphnia pulicaria]